MAKCQLLFFPCFLHHRKSISNGVQMPRNFTFLWTKRNIMGPGCAWGVPRGEHNPPGRARRPRRALVGCAHLGCPRTASLLYKYPNIPETLGESTKINSSRRKFQKHQIQSRHHHGGVHHVHWCLSDDA